MAPPSRHSSVKRAAPERSASNSSAPTTMIRGGGSATPKSAGSMDGIMFGAAGIATTSGRTTPQSSGPFSHVGTSGVVSRPNSAAAINRRRSEQATASPIDPHFPHALHHTNHHGHQQQSQSPFAPHSAASLFDGSGAPSSAKWSDDESEKGHGPERRGSLNLRSASGRWTPTILSSMLRRAGEGRFSPVSTFNSSATTQSPQHYTSPSTPSQRQFSKVMTTEPEEILSPTYSDREQARKHTPTRSRSVLGSERRSKEKQHAMAHSSTLQQISATDAKPAAKTGPVEDGYYPPANNTVLGSQHTHPLSHAHHMSTSSVSTGSSSMLMHSPQMHTHSRHASLQKMGLAQQSPILAPTSNSSPLVVPQARRGAINLRRACRRRKASSAAKRRAAIESIPAHIKVLSFVRLVVWSILHPLRACQAAFAFANRTARSVDLAFRDPRTGQRMYRPPWLGAYVPLLIWLGVSLSSTFTVLIWHTQVFQALDRMSAYLQSLGLLGRLIFGSLIFITTFPPLPLYSTLIILCGFSFGLLQAFIISYIAALSGAIVVFLLSRSLLKGWMVGLLNQSGGLKKVVRAIEKRPKLLFLVRLAPYPYNLMNTLLASSPTLTLKTYTLCTALALPKLLVHCGLGTTIKNFAAYNGAGDAGTADQAKASETAEMVKHIAGFVGVGLCVGIFLYLFSVARKAVDEELDDDEVLEADEYELMMSEDEEEGLISGDELDHDALNISNNVNGSRHGSSESHRYLDDPSSSQRTSTSYASHEIRQPRNNGVQSNVRIKAGSEATLLDSRGGGLLTIVNQQKALGANDGVTPLYIAPANKISEGSANESESFNGASSYFGGWTGGAYGGAQYGKSSAGSHSRTSLAESIVEMEKHADLFESPNSRKSNPSRSREQHQDVSIGFPGAMDQSLAAMRGGAGQKSFFGRDSQHNNAQGIDIAVDDEDDVGEEIDERRHLVEVDRNRASRRSQMGYEEERIAGR